MILFPGHSNLLLGPFLQLSINCWTPASEALLDFPQSTCDMCQVSICCPLTKTVHNVSSQSTFHSYLLNVWMIHQVNVSNTFNLFSRKPLSEHKCRDMQKGLAQTEKRWLTWEWVIVLAGSGVQEAADNNGTHFLSTCCMLSDLFVCFFHPEGVVRKLPKWFHFPFFKQHWLKGYMIHKEQVMAAGCSVGALQTLTGPEWLLSSTVPRQQRRVVQGWGGSLTPTIPVGLPSTALQGTVGCS